MGDRGSHVEALQLKLIALGYTDLGIADGIFGDRTKEAIRSFQNSRGIAATGTLDNATLNAVELEIETDFDNSEKAITSIVDKSGISKTYWENRGYAPYGYYYGMALMFAKLYKRLKQGDEIAKEIAKPLNFSQPDSLFRFDDVFADLGMNNSASEANRLRNTITLMMGLGLMESSGRHCCGWDRGKLTGWGKPSKAIRPTSNNSEAGLFQTSYDIINSVNSSVKSKLLAVITNYENHPEGFLDYFSKGTRCSESDEENYGEGDGLKFQEMSKDIPGFAVEFTAIALRNVTGHWNPVIKIGDSKHGLQIKKECDEMLKKVQDYIDGSGVEMLKKVQNYIVENGFKGIVVNAAITEPTYDDKKEAILNIAETIGQHSALKRLFDFAPESQANHWAVVDFNKPSSEERFFIFNLNEQSVKKYLVAHGKKSGELYATDFSNINGSNKSSLGIYRTKSVFQSGSHGKALGLKGLEDSNSNAELREIIIHKADYVASDYRGAGGSGRSLGCFAVKPEVLNEVVEALRDGSYINAWHS